MYCDYGHETKESRKLPLGSDSNAYLCYEHYLVELDSRSTDDSRGRPSWDLLPTQDEWYAR